MQRFWLWVALGLATGIAACAHTSRIISIPDGAVVSVNGRKIGKAPLLFSERSGPPGRVREIKLELEGYAPIIRRESVRICPTTANLMLDSVAAGFAVGFCMRDEYVYDFTLAEPASAQPKPASSAQLPNGLVNGDSNRIRKIQ